MAAVLETIESTIPSGAILTDPVVVIPPIGEVAIPDPAVTEVTVPVPGEDPLDAEVILPNVSTVMLERVYDPAVTPEETRLSVPVEVMGPPVRPVPEFT